jgi:hypothetical protein
MRIIDTKKIKANPKHRKDLIRPSDSVMTTNGTTNVGATLVVAHVRDRAITWAGTRPAPTKPFVATNHAGTIPAAVLSASYHRA